MHWLWLMNKIRVMCQRFVIQMEMLGTHWHRIADHVVENSPKFLLVVFIIHFQSNRHQLPDKLPISNFLQKLLIYHIVKSVMDAFFILWGFVARYIRVFLVHLYGIIVHIADILRNTPQNLGLVAVWFWEACKCLKLLLDLKQIYFALATSLRSLFANHITVVSQICLLNCSNNQHFFYLLMVLIYFII